MRDLRGITQASEQDAAQDGVYKNIVDGAPLSICLVGDDGRLADVNRAALELLGASDPTGIVGVDYLEHVSPADRSRVRAEMERARDGEHTDLEYVSADGRVLESRFLPLADASMGARSLCVITEDVTARRLTESALTESEEQYRLLVERSPYCIHQIDTEGRLMSMNRAGLEMIGVAEHCAIVGMPYLDAVARPDVDRIGELMRQAFRGKPSQFEFEARNGRFFASSFVPITDEEGHVLRLMGITQDVTDKLHAEFALRESEQRLELALHGASLGLWDWDLEKDLLWVDDRWAALIGCVPDEVGSDVKSMLDRVHPDDRADVEARLEANLSGRANAYESEHRLRTRDGSWRWVLDRGKVVKRSADGEPLRATGTTLDVTDRRAADEERRRLEFELQQSQKIESIGQLAGGIAHDFNNLLLIILGSVELATEDARDGRSPIENLEEIQNAAERAAALTRRLLTFGRRQDVKLVTVSLNGLLENTMEMAARLLPETIDVGFEPCAECTDVEADPRLIEQVALNLCLNARDAMPEGGRLTLSTRVPVPKPGERGAKRVELIVTDTGRGMEPEALERAFEPFFTTKGPRTGTGLGLAVAYGIVHQHEGTITLASEPGVGTTAVVSLPGSESSEPPPAPSAPARKGDLAGTETVLVVEDEPLVRQLLKSTLEPLGYTVLCAEDGQRGVELFGAHGDGIDVVILDAVMPVMDGREACETMLARRPDTRVFFMSGYRQETLPGEFLRRHSLTVLPKPFSSRALAQTVRSVLDA